MCGGCGHATRLCARAAGRPAGRRADETNIIPVGHAFAASVQAKIMRIHVSPLDIILVTIHFCPAD